MKSCCSRESSLLASLMMSHCWGYLWLVVGSPWCYGLVVVGRCYAWSYCNIYVALSSFFSLFSFFFFLFLSVVHLFTVKTMSFLLSYRYSKIIKHSGAIEEKLKNNNKIYWMKRNLTMAAALDEEDLCHAITCKSQHTIISM
jgi:hypothetical protein